MQMYKGLMRYHSAPSSLLASLRDEDCAQQPRLSDAFLQVEESEFARFLDDHLCTMVDPQSSSKPLSSSHFHSIPASTLTEEAGACLLDSEMQPQLHTEHESSALLQQPPYMATVGCSNSIKEVFGFRDPLSSIAEFFADESNQVCRLDDAQTMKISSASHWPKPPKTPAISHKGELAHVEGQLARHNSSPADVLSRLIIEEGNRGESVLHFGDPSTSQESGKGQSMPNHVCATFALPSEQISTFDKVYCASKTEDEKRVFVEAKIVKSPADERKSSLLRQNSSPADLLSQISFGGMSSLACREMASSPFSENATEEGRTGGAHQPARCWGKIGFNKAGLEDRKRGRDDHGMHRLQSSEISFTNQAYPHVGSQYAKMRRSNGLVKMEVLCRVSAKRGCATHPRSIAERVRRTKINEGIRKLQELMPNMEKQTNTVTMLDEAVEYVKYLQQQVQELSENRLKCDGRCNSKTNA